MENLQIQLEERLQIGSVNMFGGQLLDVIECFDNTGSVLVYKWRRRTGDNEIKTGSRIIVREGQVAIFVKQGRVADVLNPGTYQIDTENLPILSKLGAFATGFKSYLVSDVYFVSTRQNLDLPFGTKNAIVKNDETFNLVRLRSFGKYSMRIIDPVLFLKEFIGTRNITVVKDITEYIKSVILESVTSAILAEDCSVIELPTKCRGLSKIAMDYSNITTGSFGVRIENITIESISYPDELNKAIDEQSKISLARQDMGTYQQYNAIKAMRESVGQQNDIANLGASLALGMQFGNQMGNMINTSVGGMNQQAQAGIDRIEQLKQLKELLDCGILTEEEFISEKKKILSN